MSTAMCFSPWATRLTRATAYEKALALNPAYYNAAAQLTTLYYDRGDYQAALDMYRLMHDLKPENPKIVATIANLEEYLGDEDSAYANLVHLIDMGEDSYENLMRVASYAVKRGEFETSHMYAVLALGKKPGDNTALELAGRMAMQMNDREKAVLFYRELAEKDDVQVETIRIVEDIYRAQSDRPNLIWALKRHHELEPENVEVLGELCENFYPDGLTDEGIAYVKRGLDLAPEDGRFHILMGENYLELGQTSLALAEFHKAMNDDRWKSNAQRLIWQIEPPESDDEIAERDFFQSREIITP